MYTQNITVVNVNKAQAQCNKLANKIAKINATAAAQKKVMLKNATVKQQLHMHMFISKVFLNPFASINTATAKAIAQATAKSNKINLKNITYTFSNNVY